MSRSSPLTPLHTSPLFLEINEDTKVFKLAFANGNISETWKRGPAYRSLAKNRLANASVIVKRFRLIP